MTRALILGARGFLGGAVLELMARPGSGFDAVPASRTGAAEGWLTLDPTAEPLDHLRSSLATVACDVVVNCSGTVAGDWHALIVANLRTVERLMQAAATLPTPPRVVQVGSAAEYGDATPGSATLETDRARPVSWYGRSKLLGTEAVLQAVVRDGADAVVLRVFNPIGPGAPPHTLAGVAARRILAAEAEGRGVVQLGRLDAVRDFVDVRDVARAIAAACTSPVPAGTLINVGSGRATSARRLVGAIAAAAGYDGRVIEAVGGSPRSAKVAWQRAGLDRARDVLGWEPRIDLDRSATDLVEALRGGRTGGRRRPAAGARR